MTNSPGRKRADIRREFLDEPLCSRVHNTVAAFEHAFDASGKLKAFIYREYGVKRRHGHYEIDHLIPLGLGGADVAANLWPESRDTEPWNAERKDRLEGYLHDAVCTGRMPLERAQREIAEDWIAAYEHYIGQ